MKFINFTVIHISILIVMGTLAANYFPIQPNIVYCVLLVLVLFLFIAWRRAKRQLYQSIFFGITSYLCFSLIGYVNYQSRIPRFQAEHYIHFTSEKEPSLLQLKILDILKSDNYNEKFIAETQAVGGKSTKGKVLLYLQKDSLPHKINVDDVLLITGRPHRLAAPLNPHQFDYASYMRSTGVFRQIKIRSDHIINSAQGNITLRGFSERIRSRLIEILKQTSISNDERAVTQALVLGERKDISKELYSKYAAAGAVHIFAVSGLHIGILFMLLSWISRPIKMLPSGKVLQSILIILCLWCFAFLTGLSPSVTRAVSMFSFFAVAQSLDRETNSINTLFLSFFILLLANPLWLFHVGFQLSYIAVLSILLIHPKLYSYYRPRFYLDRLIWNIITVSISVQLGIFPMTLYYFHQFPGLFFITNLVVLPLLGILMVGGLLVVGLSALNSLPEYILVAYNFLIAKLNLFISFIANQDNFIFEHIQFSELKVVCSYLVIGSILFLRNKFNANRLIALLICVCLAICAFIFDAYSTSENKLIVFHVNKRSFLGYKHGETLKLFRNDSTMNLMKLYPIKAYRTGENINAFSEEKIPDVFKYNSELYLIIDSLGIYPKNLKHPIVVLTNSPKVNLDRLIDSLQPRLIIADGSNYTSYIKMWTKSCELKKLPFHPTGVKGAFIKE